MTDYEFKRNKIIRKYIELGSRKLNVIRLDGNSSKEHDRKVCEICIELKHKGLDFITRPVIEIKEEIDSRAYTKDMKHSTPIYHITQLIPDILYFQSNPFRPVIIEVIDSESEDHAKSKNYPDEFKVITVKINEELDGLML